MCLRFKIETNNIGKKQSQCEGYVASFLHFSGNSKQRSKYKNIETHSNSQLIDSMRRVKASRIIERCINYLKEVRKRVIVNSFRN